MGQIESVDFDEIQLFKLKNANGMTVAVSNFGGIIQSMLVPDRDGNIDDVVLGFGGLSGYLNSVDKPYFGATIGRFSNRIAGGKFSLDGQEYTLIRNNGDNHLHGGTIGFDKVVWDATPHSDAQNCGVQLKYLANDMEEGYPGNMQVSVEYTLTDKNSLEIEYLATTDKATPVNLTNHSYFNLKGEGKGDVRQHLMQIAANRYTPVDQNLIPTGKLLAVESTPFDFRMAKPIGEAIDSDDIQIQNGNGFDHISSSKVIRDAKNGSRCDRTVNGSSIRSSYDGTWRAILLW